MRVYDVIVLGAGASGLFAASALRGAGALVLERQEAPGRKLLLSGGGACNITNQAVSEGQYLGARPLFCRKALRALPPQRLVAAFGTAGLHCDEREHGQLFCREGSAAVLQALVARVRANGGLMRTGMDITEIRALHAAPQSIGPTPGDSPQASVEAGAVQPLLPGAAIITKEHSAFTPHEPGFSCGFAPALPEGARFCVRAGSETFYARTLITATGGRARPGQAKSLLGYALAAGFGHRLEEPRPALCPLPMPGNWPLHGLQGVSVEARVRLAGAASPSFTLPLLFTHQGLSGPAGLQISSYYNAALPQGGGCSRGDGSVGVLVDFLPGTDVAAWLKDPGNGKGSVRALVRGLLPERLAERLLDVAEQTAGAGGTHGKRKDGESPASAHPLRARRVAELSRVEREAMARTLNGFVCMPEDTGFAVAESTLGGVSTEEVGAADMQSRRVPGLYFCGEVLDVCGWLGGYNLHWAWASAWAAARSIAALCGARAVLELGA